MDFTQLLISYTERCFLKRSDILGISLSIFAFFVSIAAFLWALSTEPHTILKGIAEIMLCIPIILAGVYVFPRYYKNNRIVFEIEQIIFLKSDQLDQLDIKYKEIILEEVKKFYTTNGKNLEKLKIILTNPETLLNSPSKSPNDNSQATRHSRWLSKWHDGEE